MQTCGCTWPAKDSPQPGLSPSRFHSIDAQSLRTAKCAVLKHAAHPIRGPISQARASRRASRQWFTATQPSKGSIETRRLIGCARAAAVEGAADVTAINSVRKAFLDACENKEAIGAISKSTSTGDDHRYRRCVREPLHARTVRACRSRTVDSDGVARIKGGVLLCRAFRRRRVAAPRPTRCRRGGRP